MTPIVRNVAHTVSWLFGNLLFHRMHLWQVGRFFRDAEVRKQFLPVLYEQFTTKPGAQPAFFRLNEDLRETIRSRAAMIPALHEFKRPVRIIFGAADPYLNKGVRRPFMTSFPVPSCSCFRARAIRANG